MNDKTQDSLLTFPCQFTLKVMGRASSNFEQEATTILKSFYPNFDDNYQKRPSRNGNYLALTFCIEATSKDELDHLYSALTNCEGVVMVL